MDTKTIINYLPIDTYQQFIEAVDALKSIDDPAIKENYYYALAVMSRVSTCVSYLNMHSTCPYTEEDLLSFMMYSCMLIDSIKLVLREFGIEGPEPTLYYFKDACLSNALFTDEKKYPTDDKFFEYFRSFIEDTPGIAANSSVVVGFFRAIILSVASVKTVKGGILSFPAIVFLSL